MNSLRSPFFAVPVAIVAGLAVVTYLIVAGGDDAPDLSEIPVTEGRVSCDMFSVAAGYRYTMTVVQDLKERPPEMAPSGTDQYRAAGFVFTAEVDGSVQGLERVQQHVTLPEQPQESDFVLVDGTLYFRHGDDAFEGVPIEEALAPLSYIPQDACIAIAPDLFLEDLEGVSEEINGVAATRYRFDGLETNFPARHPSFGASSDMGRFVNSLTGDIWVAEVGGYIVKMDVLGQGTYENGRGLELYMAYELSSVNEKVSIEAPI